MYVSVRLANANASANLMFSQSPRCMPLCCDADKGQILGNITASAAGSGIDSMFYIEQRSYNVPFALRARNSRHATTERGKS